MAGVERPGEVIIFEVHGRLSKIEFQEYLCALDDCIRRARPFTMIVDASAPELLIEDLPSRHWERKRADGIRALHRGIAFVAGAMEGDRIEALYAMQPPGVPYAFFVNFQEARHWARTTVGGPGGKTRAELVTQRLANPPSLGERLSY